MYISIVQYYMYVSYMYNLSVHIFGVAAEIMAEINKAGFTRPSPIQVSQMYML